VRARAQRRHVAPLAQRLGQLQLLQEQQLRRVVEAWLHAGLVGCRIKEGESTVASNKNKQALLESGTSGNNVKK
jgi:hypothetical protein